jgi:hypothetical protein
MTKVQIRFRVLHPLDDAALAKLAGMHALYGIQKVDVAGDGTLRVEYDATRLCAAEVEAALAAAGISAAR